MPEPRSVRAMFARIAGRYDLLNHLLSVGIDRRWRRRTVELAGDLRGARVVDVCCGTGDLALLFARRGARVVGVDFTPEMLLAARRKSAIEAAGALFVHGDALALPVPAGVADVASIAFGIRNVADRGLALRELLRILRPGGLALVLEFSMPPGPLFGRLYRAYSSPLLPRVGRWISGDAEAYEYLPRTVAAWPAPPDFERELAQAGFADCGFERWTGGIACLHHGRRPAGDGAPFS